ncbi:hypothetical protein EYF80_049180 [Liparis tanakae]|uniref:Uncharacterized protein n=1 Tax=Liparis tanakae TaxID=230148 RepID=A0A4Z2FI71_9TELE|nr:hypothetical protein EYF80_049180 [Liparis tanakae]
MSLGRKCAAPFVFFTRFPFMTCPSRLMPMYHARPDWVCLYRMDDESGSPFSCEEEAGAQPPSLRPRGTVTSPSSPGGL